MRSPVCSYTALSRTPAAMCVCVSATDTQQWCISIIITACLGVFRTHRGLMEQEEAPNNLGLKVFARPLLVPGSNSCT